MSSVKENNKRIAKNTAALYFRMFLTMGITLYTSRVILKTLGVDDFGIYNVVAGIITMMGVIKGVMSGATSRFMNFALGKDDETLASKAFSISLCIYIVLCLLLLLISETIGVWFLNNKLIIPENRIIAANWVFQFCILSCINNFISMPYNAAIIAHEKMNAFAYISILEVALKLLIVYALLFIPYDRLIIYGLLLLFSDLIIRYIYRWYCKRNFKECNFHLYKDKAMYMEILSYSSWNLIGTLAGLIRGQGLNILLNMFFNPGVNAARGIAYQVNNAITHFATNFYTAVRPQITKYYARGEIDNMNQLVFRSAKFSFFLIMILSLPVIVEAPYIIDWWLGETPEYVVIFVRYIVVISALDCMQNPLKTVAQATGKIATYEITIGIITLLNIPISYYFLTIGGSPIVVFKISLILMFLCFLARLIILYNLVSFPALNFMTHNFLSCVVVSILSLAVPCILYCQLEETFIKHIVVLVSCLLFSIISIYFVGLSSKEKMLLKNIIRKKIFKD